MTVGERLPEVWHGPFRRRVRGHIVMEDSGVPRSMTMNTYSVRNVAVTTTKKSHAAITQAWLRTKSPPPLLYRACEPVDRRAGTFRLCEAVP